MSKDPLYIGQELNVLGSVEKDIAKSLPTFVQLNITQCV